MKMITVRVKVFNAFFFQQIEDGDPYDLDRLRHNLSKTPRMRESSSWLLLVTLFVILGL